MMIHDTRRVQRLTAAPKTDFHARIDQAFGGGAVGLSTEGWRAIQSIFSLDYMGAAEYEFGTIPSCLKQLAHDAEHLVAASTVIPAKSIEPNWNRQREARTKRGTPRKKQPVHPPIEDRTVYLLCRKADLDEVEKRVHLLAGGKISTKCGTRFSNALDPISDFDCNVKGWLEVDNGYFFFLDKEMWAKATRMFTGKLAPLFTGKLAP
jgi:hypothetical protein